MTNERKLSLPYFNQMASVGPRPTWQHVPLAHDHLYNMQVLKASELANDPGKTSTPTGGYQLSFHSTPNAPGSTIPAPKLILIYLGQWWDDTSKLESFARDVMVEGYLEPLKDYGSGNGTFLGSVKGPSVSDTGIVTDARLRQTLQSLLASDLPKPDGHTLYSLMLPDGLVVQLDANSSSCSSFCGYHDALDDLTFYTVQPATNCQGCNLGDAFAGATMTLGHEIAEACTDAVPGKGWFVTAPGQPQDGMENADEWSWIAKRYGPWTVQGYQVNGVGNDFGVYVPAKPPTLSIGAPASANVGEQVTFTSVVQGASSMTALSCIWDFGDKSPKLQGVLMPETHTYKSPGTYVVICTIFDKNTNLSVTAHVSIAIIQPKVAVWDGDAWVDWAISALQWTKQYRSAQEMGYIGQELSAEAKAIGP